MALFKGDRKLTLFKGDRKPFALFKGDKQITGAVKTHLEGTDIVKWESPYKSDIPNVETEGLGTQDKLSGKNLLSDFTRYPNPFTEIIPPLKVKTGDIIRFSYDKLNGEKYRLMFFGSNVDGSPFDVTNNNPDGYVRFFYTADKNRLQLGSDTYQPKDFEVNNPFLINGIQYWRTTVDEPFINPILTVNEPTAPYEPYCGGIPAPNPQYPIEPRFNSGNKIKAYGANLSPYKQNFTTTRFKSILCYEWLLEKDVGKTITISFDGWLEADGNPSGRIIMYAYQASGISISDVFGVPFTYERQRFVFTTTVHDYGYVEGRTRGAIGFYDNAGMNHYTVKDFQVEYGDKATPYQPYFNGGTADIPTLRAIPNTEFKDTYDAQRGIITRRVEELTLSGEEEVYKGNSNAKGYNVYFTYIKKYPDFGAVNASRKILSNYFIWESWGYASSSEKTSIAVNDSGSTIFFKQQFQTVEDFKAFLKQKFTEGNPVKIWYALKTPYEEKVSTIPLRQDWNGQIMQTGGDCGYAPMRADVFTEFRR